MKAKVQRVWAAWVTCPKCGTELGTPGSGSLLWLQEDVQQCGGQVNCYACGAALTVKGPKE